MRSALDYEHVRQRSIGINVDSAAQREGVRAIVTFILKFGICFGESGKGILAPSHRRNAACADRLIGTLKQSRAGTSAATFHGYEKRIVETVVALKENDVFGLSQQIGGASGEGN